MVTKQAWRWPLAVAAFTVALPASAGRVLTVPAIETLNATGGLQAHIVNQFSDPVGFAEATSGAYIVLDRRQHTVYGINAKQTVVRKILQVGFETGKILQPAVLALSRDDIFAVADAPSGNERIQYFTLEGTFLGGFYLQSRLAPRVVAGPVVLNGVGSMSFTGKTFLVSRPESGALFSELDVQGAVVRHIGTLRPTGQERDGNLHIALNAGIPLPDPTGGFYFVFQTGRPMFRKYDAAGTLLFERHVEGSELDAQIQSLPLDWPARAPEALPFVPPLIRTAAVDAGGRLWISLVVPFTYVYDSRGEKTRTVQFHGASLVAPTTLFFAPRGRVLVTPGCYEFSTR